MKDKKRLPNIFMEDTDYNKLLKIISIYSLKSNKKISIKEAIVNLIREKKIE